MNSYSLILLEVLLTLFKTFQNLGNKFEWHQLVFKCPQMEVIYLDSGNFIKLSLMLPIYTSKLNANKMLINSIQVLYVFYLHVQN